MVSVFLAPIITQKQEQHKVARNLNFCIKNLGTGFKNPSRILKKHLVFEKIELKRSEFSVQLVNSSVQKNSLTDIVNSRNS